MTEYVSKLVESLAPRDCSPDAHSQQYGSPGSGLCLPELSVAPLSYSVLDYIVPYSIINLLQCEGLMLHLVWRGLLEKAPELSPWAVDPAMIDPESSLPFGLLAKGYLLHLKRLVRVLTAKFE